MPESERSERRMPLPRAPEAGSRRRQASARTILSPLQFPPMQTRYLIIASLITALVILGAGAWWFYARAV